MSFGHIHNGAGRAYQSHNRHCKSLQHLYRVFRFKAARSLADDLKILLVKLDIEKTRLLIWGNDVGILELDNWERAPGLRDPAKVEVVTKYLERIKALFSETEKLEKKYGLKAATPDEEYRDSGVSPLSRNVWIFSRLPTSALARNAMSSGKHSRISKTKWAIHNKAKFEGLRVHLKDFIHGLHEVVPISKEAEDRMIQGGISSIIDLSKLRLVQSACSESNYQSWADMASVAIEESTAGTVDRRNIDEWIGDIPGVASHAEVTDSFEDKLTYVTNVYFIFTGPCSNQHPELLSDPNR